MNRLGHLFGRALRETGQALDRTALRIAENEIFQETYTRHRAVMPMFGKVCFIVENWFSCCNRKFNRDTALSIIARLQEPTIAEEVYIAPSAAVIGAVSIKNKSSVTKSPPSFQCERLIVE